MNLEKKIIKMSVTLKIKNPFNGQTQVNEFFSSLTSGERIFYNISQTGYIPVNYRGMLPISKNVTNNPEETFSVTIMVDPAIDIPKDTYQEPTCENCIFHHIK